MFERLKSLSLSLGQWLAVSVGSLIGFLLILLRMKNKQIQKLKVENLEDKIKSSDLSYEQQVKKAEEAREHEEDVYHDLIDPKS